MGNCWKDSNQERSRLLPQPILKKKTAVIQDVDDCGFVVFESVNNTDSSTTGLHCVAPCRFPSWPVSADR